MKNQILRLLLFSLLLGACAPLAVPEPASSPFTLSADGLFIGSAEPYLVAEEELAGQYVIAFGPVDRTNMPSNESLEEQDFRQATGRLSNWVVQFTRPVGSGDSSGPSYVTNYATLYSTLDGPYLSLSPNRIANYYQAVNTGVLVEWPDSPDIQGEHRVFVYPDGIMAVVFVYRNLTFTFLAEGQNDQETYDYLTELANPT